MRDFKNIDRIFQENLKDFEVSPPVKAWDAIEKQLVVTSTKRRFPIWIKIASVAALLVLFFSIGAIYLLPSTKFTENIFPKNSKLQKNIDKKENLKSKIDLKKVIPIEDKSTILASEVLNKEKNVANLNKELKNSSKENLEETTSNKNVLNKFYLSDAINSPFSGANKSEVTKKEISTGKFTVATIFAPIYFNSFGDGSSVDSQFSNNPTSGSSSFSYGVKVAYQLTDKFSLQSGVNLINLGLTTNNVYISPGVAVIGFSNLSNNPVLGRSESISTLKGENLNSVDANRGSLNQVFGYVEIPVELKYNVTDGKLGINLVGGFSTLLLNRDEIFIETNNFTQSLGSSNNLRNINFSGNIGLDLDYLIHKNLFINISPMFKVQTNTFSKNAGSIQPYYLGVYTGLNYKF